MDVLIMVELKSIIIINYRFLPMKAMTPDMMKMITPIDYVSRIAHELQGLHMETPPLPRDENIWMTVDDWISQVKTFNFADSPEKDAIFSTLDFDWIENENNWLKSILPSPKNSHGLNILEGLVL